MVLPSRPKAHRRWLVAGDGGTAEPRRGMPATASLHCSSRARYELHEITTELPKKKRRTRGVPVVVDRMSASSGEVRPWRRRRKNGQRPSPTARMARLSGGGRRGEHGEDGGGTRCAPTGNGNGGTAAAAALLAAGERGGEAEGRRPNESVGSERRVRGVMRRTAARRGLARQDVGDVWPPRGSRALPRSATESPDSVR